MTELEKELMKKVDHLESELAYMREQMDVLLRQRYGRSKESLKEDDPDQLSLFEEDCVALEESEPEEIIVVQRRKKRKGLKQIQLHHLPAQEVHYELSGEECQCPHCQQALKEIGQKQIREEPIFIPAKLEKKVHIQHSYACPHCEKEGETTIIQAKVPRALLAHSLASASLVSEVLTQKYDLHLPFYRQEKEWKRYGLELTRKTMAHWLTRVCTLYLAPVAALLQKTLVQQEAIHADETTYRMTKSQKQKNYMWLFRSIETSEQPVVLYAYNESRGESALTKVIPQKYAGYLHCDGYGTYGTLPHAQLVGCLAHVRRRFFEAIPPNLTRSSTHTAVEAVKKCDAFFRLDRQIREEYEEYDQICAARQSKLKPLLDDFGSWLTTLNVSTKSKLGTAVSYTQNQWTKLQTFLKDGRLALSNNLAERAIKPIVIGRKNYLFSTSEAGAKANAVVYSIIETAKANGLDVRKYLAYLFEQLPQENILSEDVLRRFLPWQKDVQIICK